MAKSPKKVEDKAEESNLEKIYSKARKNLRRRIKTAEQAGFDFPENIIPNKPKKIKPESIERLNKLRGEFLYKKALAYETPEGEFVTAKQGIKRIKEDIRFSNIAKSAKGVAKRKANKVAEEFGLGKNAGSIVKEDFGEELYKRYSKLYEESVEQARLFEQSLSEEDYILLKNAQIKHEVFELGKEIPEYDGKGHQIVELGRDTGEPVLPDEGIESESEEEDEDSYGYYEEGEDVVRFEDEESKKKDARYKEWVDQYNRQKSLPPKERVYAKEGEVVYAGIKERISRFWAELRDPTFKRRHNTDNNESKANLLETLLENTIKIEGFNVVMNRLSGKGHEIDNALDTMLYDSDDNKVDAAYMYIAQIINGGAMTLKQSMELTEAAERMSFSREAEDYQL